MPGDTVAEALADTVRLWSEIEALEAAHDLPSTSMPDGGMAWMVHRWASGERLDTVLRGQEMAAGDFVRRCKQLVDLLDQVRKAATDDELRRTARTAVAAVLRGVVAAEGAVFPPSIWGKLKTNVQFLAILLAILRYDEPLGPLLLDEWAMLAAAFVTVMSAVEYLARFSSALVSPKR